MNEYNYKFNCSEYVLHEGDKPIGKNSKWSIVGFWFREWSIA